MLSTARDGENTWQMTKLIFRLKIKVQGVFFLQGTKDKYSDFNNNNGHTNIGWSASGLRIENLLACTSFRFGILIKWWCDGVRRFVTWFMLWITWQSVQVVGSRSQGAPNRLWNLMSVLTLNREACYYFPAIYLNVLSRVSQYKWRHLTKRPATSLKNDSLMESKDCVC